jgi:heptosyltransferase-2
VNRIAVFLPNWIGDVVMATPAIRALREHFPDAHLMAVGKPYVMETLSGAPWFQDTIAFDKRGPKSNRFWSVVQRLRQNPPTAAVLFPNSFRAAALAKLGGCQHIVGFARYGRDLLLTKRLYATRDHRGRYKPVPAIDDYNKIVLRLGVPDPGHRMELFTTPQDETLADRIWEQFQLHRYPEVIGLNPGGAFGASKHWPTEHFAELARMLTRQRNCAVIALCGPAEREVAREIARRGESPAIVSLADSQLSLGLTKAVVRRLALLVTTDSGPRHFAAAFQRPVVTLFGPTHIGWTETYFPLAIHLQKPVPCGPCQLRTCPLDHRCMTSLHPTEVFTAAERLLNQRTIFTDDPSRQERRHDLTGDPRPLERLPGSRAVA